MSTPTTGDAKTPNRVSYGTARGDDVTTQIPLPLRRWGDKYSVQTFTRVFILDHVEDQLNVKFVKYNNIWKGELSTMWDSRDCDIHEAVERLASNIQKQPCFISAVSRSTRQIVVYRQNTGQEVLRVGHDVIRGASYIELMCAVEPYSLPEAPPAPMPRNEISTNATDAGDARVATDPERKQACDGCLAEKCICDPHALLPLSNRPLPDQACDGCLAEKCICDPHALLPLSNRPLPDQRIPSGKVIDALYTPTLVGPVNVWSFDHNAFETMKTNELEQVVDSTRSLDAGLEAIDASAMSQDEEMAAIKKLVLQHTNTLPVDIQERLKRTRHETASEGDTEPSAFDENGRLRPINPEDYSDIDDEDEAGDVGNNGDSDTVPDDEETVKQRYAEMEKALGGGELPDWEKDMESKTAHWNEWEVDTQPSASDILDSVAATNATETPTDEKFVWGMPADKIPWHTWDSRRLGIAGTDSEQELAKSRYSASLDFHLEPDEKQIWRKMIPPPAIVVPDKPEAPPAPMPKADNDKTSQTMPHCMMMPTFKIGLLARTEPNLAIQLESADKPLVDLTYNRHFAGSPTVFTFPMSIGRLPRGSEPEGRLENKKPPAMNDFKLDAFFGAEGYKRIVVAARRRAHKSWNVEDMALRLTTTGRHVGYCVSRLNLKKWLGDVVMFAVSELKSAMEKRGNSFDVLFVDELLNMSDTDMKSLLTVPHICIVHTPSHEAATLKLDGFTELTICVSNPSLARLCACQKCLAKELASLTEQRALITPEDVVIGELD